MGTKAWIVIAIVLLVIGVITFSVVMTINGWDFTKLSTESYVLNTYDFEDDFTGISVDTDTADIKFVLSENTKCKVECLEATNNKCSVTVSENTLIIKQTDDRKWYDNIAVSFTSPQITIHLAKSEYNSLVINESTGQIEIPDSFTFNTINANLSTGDVTNYASVKESLSIKTTTGDITLENLSAKSADLSVSTGKISVTKFTCDDLNIKVSTGKATLNDVACKNLTSEGNTGDITLNSVFADEKFDIVRSTGDITINESDASRLFLKTSTGDISGTLLSDKVFVAKTSTGSVDLPQTTTGGKCEVVTSTGDISFSVVE